jgi:hypothetical protein
VPASLSRYVAARRRAPSHAVAHAHAHTQGGDSAPVIKATGVSGGKKVSAAARAFNVLLPLLLVIAAFVINGLLSSKK